MRKITYILLLLLLFTSFNGCEDDNAVNPPASIDGLSFYGLQHNKSMYYIRTDTVVSFNPFDITISETSLSVMFTGSDDDWIIHNDQKPIINLKVGSSSVIQNGYWTEVNSQDSLFYFAVPPLLMERTLSTNLTWDYSTPLYQDSSAAIYLPFYIANFGFQVTKSYMGQEDIITPAGEFTAYRFDLMLFTSEFGDEPVAEITEYFVPNIGLVKQDMFTGGSRRSITLVNYTN